MSDLSKVAGGDNKPSNPTTVRDLRRTAIRAGARTDREFAEWLVEDIGWFGPSRSMTGEGYDVAIQAARQLWNLDPGTIARPAAPPSLQTITPAHPPEPHESVDMQDTSAAPEAVANQAAHSMPVGHSGHEGDSASEASIPRLPDSLSASEIRKEAKSAGVVTEDGFVEWLVTAQDWFGNPSRMKPIQLRFAQSDARALWRSPSAGQKKRRDWTARPTSDGRPKGAASGETSSAAKSARGSGIVRQQPPIQAAPAQDYVPITMAQAQAHQRAKRQQRRAAYDQWAEGNPAAATILGLMVIVVIVVAVIWFLAADHNSCDEVGQRLNDGSYSGTDAEYFATVCTNR